MLEQNNTRSYTITAWLYIKSAWTEWVAEDMLTLLFILKAAIAGLIAFATAIILHLPDPRTAVFTSFIVMQPQNGMVLSKSYYRAIGTVAGAIVAIVIMSLFAQNRVLFIAALAVWIGFCTAAGVKYRNFQSYGFFLSGYTVCIIALPAIQYPNDLFYIATSRFFEVITGIISATIISDILFPNNMLSSLLARERERFLDVLVGLSSYDIVFDVSKTTTKDSASFLGGIVGFSDRLSNSLFESTTTRQYAYYAVKLNYAYMNLTTTLYSLQSIVAHMHSSMPQDTIKTLRLLYEPVVLMLQKVSHTAVATHDIASLLQFSLDVRKQLEKQIANQLYNKQNSLDIKSYYVYMSATDLLLRLLDELFKYCELYLMFLNLHVDNKQTKQQEKIPQFKYNIDKTLIALAVLRGSGVLILGMLFWILSGWQYATFTVTIAVAIGLLTGVLPRPLDMLADFLKGALVAAVVSAVYNFYILPKFTFDFITVSFVITPMFMFLAWLATKPRFGGFLFGFMFIFMTQTAFGFLHQSNFAQFLQGTIAAILGIMLATAAYLLVNFWSCALTQQKIAKILSKRVAALCYKPLDIQRERLESVGRDLIQQFSTHGRLNVRSSRFVFKWLLSSLEIGYAILSIRKQLIIYKNASESEIVETALYALQRHFEVQDEQTNALMIHYFEDALLHVQKDKEMRSKLALIYNIISNKSSLATYKDNICH